jgi:2-polyprenyl-3-methyl-5-hydroxy-6-metoxy-1,4-benzoquinol methylase
MYLREMAEHGYNPESIGPFHEHMIPWLMSSNNVGKNEKIIDIGAGQGHCLLPMYNSGWRNLTAVDIDRYNFRLFKEKYGINTLCCDASVDRIDIPDGSVGAVFCFHLIEHIAAPQHILSEIHRVLKPSAKLFLVTPDWRKQYKTFWRDPTHVHPYDKESIFRLLKMHDFQVEIHSWGTSYGLGRVLAYKYAPTLGLIGQDILAIASK